MAVGQRELGSCLWEHAPPPAQALPLAPTALPVSTPCLQASENWTQLGTADGLVCACVLGAGVVK